MILGMDNAQDLMKQKQGLLTQQYPENSALSQVLKQRRDKLFQTKMPDMSDLNNNQPYPSLSDQT